MERQDFLVRIGHVAQPLHKPSVAVGVGIGDGRRVTALQGQDDVLHVEHVQHGEEFVAVHAVQLRARFHDCVHESVAFGVDVLLDKLLVAAQFGRMVAADALVEVRRVALVKRVGGQVEHAVVERRVLKDVFVRGRGLEGLSLLARGDEKSVVEVALVHLPHVGEAEHEYAAHHPSRAQAAHVVGQQQEQAGGDDAAAAPGIGREDGAAHVLDVLDDGGHHGAQFGVLCRGVVEHGQLLLRHVSAEEHVGQEGEEQGHAARQAEAHVDGAQVLFQHLRFVHHLLQGQHGQQGDGELRHHEDGGYGAELVVHRHVVDEQVGEPHEVVPPREEHAQHRGREQAPFHRAAHDEQAQHEEHQHEGAHVDGAARSGLLAPVLSQLVGHEGIFRFAGLARLFVGAERELRGAALGVGHEQRPGFADAVAPGRDVVAVQSASRLVGRVLHRLVRQFAAPAHALLAVFIRVVEVGQVDAYAQHGCRREHRRGAHPLLYGFRLHGLDEPGQRHEEHHGQEVVGHLHVVGEYLQSHEEGRHERAREQSAAVAEHHAGDGGRDEGQHH